MRITYWFWKFGFLGEGDILPEARKKWGAMKNWEGGSVFGKNVTGSGYRGLRIWGVVEVALRAVIGESDVKLRVKPS